MKKHEHSVILFNCQKKTNLQKGIMFFHLHDYIIC